MIARHGRLCSLLLAAAAFVVMETISGTGAEKKKGLTPQFRTSDRCIACHNGLVTASGEDISIGFDWRSSTMANSSRDPYWQASVRRESIDHPESTAAIEDECSICHMPIPTYEAMLRGARGQVFAHLPLSRQDKDGRPAADGASCAVFHQISRHR